MKKFFVIVMPLALLTACGKKEEAAVPTARPIEPARPVVQATPVESPLFTGAVAMLEGSAMSPVQARISGYLINQIYRDGELVKAGDLLFVLNAKPFSGGEGKGDVRIFATMDGMAERATVGLGDLVGPDAILTTISALDPIKAAFTMARKVYAERAERIAKLLAVPLQARPANIAVTRADGSSYSAKGRLDSVEAGGAGGAGSVEPVTVVVIIPNPERVLRPGDYVKISETIP